jgi:hypothetical protein
MAALYRRIVFNREGAGEGNAVTFSNSTLARSDP